MEIKVIHHTTDLLPIEDDRELSLAEQAIIVGGREAGICYMADDYFSNKINNSSSAVKRANTIIGSGHHSPFDHYSIGFEISGLPKIIAMLLNSVGVYTTSEKSGRYTKMHPETELELEIYNKWAKKFEEIINATYNADGVKIDPKMVSKLALENARYMLSVFTPTSMGYTVSFRQLSYMHYWAQKLISNIKNNPDPFGEKLLPYLNELDEKMFKPYSQNGIVKDKNNNGFNFFRLQNGLTPWDGRCSISDTYTVAYDCSFTCLAQAHRHRKLHYEMEFSGDYGKATCFIPPILEKYPELVDEWRSDFDKLRQYFPQCTLVHVIESGRTEDFIDKCKERLCGRAQLEVVHSTMHTMELMLDNMPNFSSNLRKKFEDCSESGKVCAKCKFSGYTCTEPCIWGGKEALTRLI